jgi:uncharacterized protein (DUF849 family)
MLKACLNGGRAPGTHPAVPVTAAQLAVDAERCQRLGAGAVHVHPRGPDGRESLAADTIAEAVDAIRVACPGLPVGVSTGAWIERDPDRRIGAIERWVVLPDFASVNVHEEGAAEVAAALYRRGVAVEAGIWTVAAVDAWRDWSTPCLRLLVECMADDVTQALVDADAILRAIGAEHETDVLLHAEGPAVWAVLREAVARGLDTRVGLEDTLVLPDGTPAPDNAALVAAAVDLGAGSDRPRTVKKS